MFTDTAKVFIKSGDGGDGCMSFHREKFVPNGGPDGGDGGDGGNVVFIGDPNINNLSRFRHSPKLIAGKGQPGKGNFRSGKKGKDYLIRVPCGTIIRDDETGEVIMEILTPHEKVFVLKGGKGGRGNQHFATPENQAPRKFEYGTSGQEVNALLELKVIADVGLLGLPNAGKSSMISCVSKARPKVASYPFTTLHPSLGVVSLTDYRSLVIADIPGIIEGASKGKGLGLQFLRHVERTKTLLYVIDVSPYADMEPSKAFQILREEIISYGHALNKKPFLIAANKTDLDPESETLNEFLSYLGREYKEKVIPISVATREGIDELIDQLDKMVFGDNSEKEEW